MKVIREIRHWLHFHNPKMLFCTHRFNVSGQEYSKYGTYTMYICSKCGKNITIQNNNMINTRG